MSEAAPKPPRTGRRPVLSDRALWGVLAGQALLSLPGMAGRTLWLDEAYTAVLARKTISGIASALSTDTGPPGHYVLLHAWRMLFGESAFALRLPSLVFALGGTGLLFWLADSLFDRKTARIAAALFAVNPLVVYYAGEARAYTLLLFFSLLFLAVALHPTLRPWVRFPLLGLSLAALVYSHNVGWFAAGAALGTVALFHRRTLADWRFWAATGLAGVAYLPWVSPFLAQVAYAELRGTTDWMQYFWKPWNPLASLAGFPPFGLRAAFVDLPALPGTAWIPVVALWFAPVALAFVPRETVPKRGRGRKKTAGSKERTAADSSPPALGGPAWMRDVRSLAVFVALGLLLPALWSAISKPIYLQGRTDFFALPAVILLLAVGLRGMRQTASRGYWAILVLISVVACVTHHRRVPPMDEKEWTSILAVQARPGDVVLCTGLTRPAVEHGLSDRGLTFVSYPRDMEQQLAHVDDAWYAKNLDLAAEAVAVVESASAQLASGNRLWAVMSLRPLNEPLMRALAAAPELSAMQPVTSPRMGMQRLNDRIALLPYVKKDTAVAPTSGP